MEETPLPDPPPKTRRIAVVPAYNEERTVVAVLDRLYQVVDELVVVDDGSTDGTRAAIQGWLPGHERARLLCHATNQGMSEAYELAFTDLRRRLESQEISPGDLIFTVDADGQHELSVLDELERIARDESVDALIVRRDLSNYPRYKRAGNWLMSAWATLWAGHPLPDVESGYRIFRMGALAHALDFYRGYKYSETVEVAVILCRLGYTVRNDVTVPVPRYRSRTNLKDVIIDLAAMPAAWWRVVALRRRPAGIPRTVALWLPLAVLLPFAALLTVIASKNIFLGVDAINNYVHVWYLNDALVNHLDFPLHAEPLDNGRATAMPYGGVPWLLGAVLYQFLGDRSVTLLLVIGLVGLVATATFVRPAMRSPWMTILFIINPFFVDAVFSVQFPFIWSGCIFFLYVMLLDRRRYALAGALGWMSVSAQPINGGGAVLAYGLWAFWQRPAERPKLLLLAGIGAVALIPVAVLALDTPALSDNGTLLIVRSIIADIPRRGLILAFPFIIQALGPVILRRYQLVAGTAALALAVWLPFANGAFGIAEGNYTTGLRSVPRDPYIAFV
ncbi:MAG: glycosyltransferase family 2 protein, partial [Dehalococcoidia bacterium]